MREGRSPIDGNVPASARSHASVARFPVTMALCILLALSGGGLCACAAASSTGATGGVGSQSAAGSSATQDSAGVSSSTGQSAESGETHVVTDSIGREVEVPVNPERVAALDSFTGQAMVMAQAGDQLVAVPNGVKTDIILQQIYPGLTEVATPQSDAAVNIESLMNTGAQVAIIKSAFYYSGDIPNQLDKAGIPYVVIGYATMDDQIDALNIIGQVCGGKVQENLEAMATYYGNAIDIVKEHAARIPDEDRVRVYHAINEVVRTDGATSLGTDWITCTGAIDVSSGQELGVGETDYNTTLEQVFVWDPDVIICNAPATTDYLYSDSKWTSLRAVREQKVYTIPIGATRWGQPGSVETFFAMFWLGKTIYPDYFADIDLQAEVTTFYHDYLGVDLDDETYQQILSGSGIRKKSDNSGTTNGDS